jgi:hypothetical protein
MSVGPAVGKGEVVLLLAAVVAYLPGVGDGVHAAGVVVVLRRHLPRPHLTAAVTGIESFTVAPVPHAAGCPGLLFLIGKVAFFMLVPVLAGFIAFAMADRMGLVPGFVVGLIATATGRGFPGRPHRRPAGRCRP